MNTFQDYVAGMSNAGDEGSAAATAASERLSEMFMTMTDPNGLIDLMDMDTGGKSNGFCILSSYSGGVHSNLHGNVNSGDRPSHGSIMLMDGMYRHS